MQMPFGKYRGCDIRRIPHSYLHWLLANCSLAEYLENEVRQVLGLEDPPMHPLVPVNVDHWYRTLSIRFHPVHGGTKGQMLAINVAKDLLINMLSTETANTGA